MFLTYKAVKFDRGGEYESNEFNELCAKFGIIHQTTAPYTPQQNGIAKRKNKTLKEMVNSMLVSSGAPQNLWGGSSFNCKLYFKQSIPQETWSISFELWYGRASSYYFFKMWGCLAKVLAPLSKKTKLGAKTMDCMFIGYALNSSAYRFSIH